MPRFARSLGGRRLVVAGRLVALLLVPAALASCVDREGPPLAGPAPAMTVEPGAPTSAPPETETGDATSSATAGGPAQPATSDAPVADKDGFVPLFDGKSLDGWTSTKFGGEGDVEVIDGAIVLTQGNDMTGITSTRKDLPTSNYEIEWEAKRVEGNDFFGTLTFPVKKDPCSLVLGGWGGGVVGLSSVNGFDASENETTHYEEFEKGRWYKVRLRVTDEKVTAWIDGKEVVDLELADRTISVRIEVELSRPLGFSTWRTAGALRNIRMKRLVAETP